MSKILNAKIYREDSYLLVIFIMMAIAVIVKSYFNIDGYLSSDSTNYLKLAQNLLDGNGYYVSSYGSTDQDREFFAIWPVGYATFIYITSTVTGLSVFWASKLLNIILVGVILGIFRVLFKRNAYVYGLILLFSSYIEIFSYTWSETLFVASLLWFTTSLYFLIVKPKTTITLYFSIMMASLFLFMSRYIGAFSFGLIGLLGLYYGLVKKEKFKATMLIGIAIFNIIMMALYLYHNYLETGFLTGMQRISSLETNLELFYMLQKAILSEILIITCSKAITMKAIVMYFIQILILFFLFWKYKNNMLVANKNNQESIRLSYVFASIGLVYLFFIILMRWMTQFDEYSFRLLAPGSFLLFIAIIFFIQQRATEEFFTVLKRLILFFAMLSFLFNVPFKAWKAFTLNPTYFEYRKVLNEKFENIEKGSIVIFTPKDINYLHTDIHVRLPYSFPYSLEKETWVEFMERIDFKNQKNIYLFISKQKLSPKEFDQSVIDFVSKYDDGTLVKLK